MPENTTLIDLLTADLFWDPDTGYIVSDVDDGRILEELSEHPEDAGKWGRVVWYDDWDNRHEMDWLPLHAAIATRRPDAVVMRVLAAYREAANEPTEETGFPLHFAAETGCYGGGQNVFGAYRGSGFSEEVLTALLQENPDAIKSQNNPEENMPLHCALVNNAPEAVVRVLFEAHPGAARVKNKFGKYPLHYAAEHGTTEAVVRMLLDEYPQAARKRNEAKYTPLHYATKNDAPEAVIRMLVEAYPAGASQKNEDGYTPLKFAVERRASTSLLSFLLAGGQEYDSGNTPLHTACKNSASEDVIEFLLESYPDSVRQLNEDSETPLHVAIFRGASDAVVNMLFDVYPDVATQKNEAWCTMLHHATRFGRSDAVVTKIFEANPGAASQRDDSGCYPLHFAAKFSEVLVSMLLEACPEAASTACNKTRAVDRGINTNQFPLHRAAATKGASEAVVKIIFDAYPPAAMQKDDHQQFPLHLAAENGASVAVTNILLEAYRNAVREKDRNDNTPLHCAVENENSTEAVVMLLLDANPDAAKQKNYFGATPLHMAVNSKSLTVVTAMVDACPDATRVTDESGKLPINLATGMLELKNGSENNYDDGVWINGDGEWSNHDDGEWSSNDDGGLPNNDNDAWSDNVEKIEEIEPEQVSDDTQSQMMETMLVDLVRVDMPLRAGDGMPVNHAGSWTTCVALNNLIATDVVRRLLAPKTIAEKSGCGFGIHIHELIRVLDDQGRTALEVSTKGPRSAIYEHLLFCGRYELSMDAPEHVSSTSVVLRARDLNENADYGAVFDLADRDGDKKLDRLELSHLANSIRLDPKLFLQGTDKYVKKEDFVGICKRQLGDGPRSVVIKLMREKDQWNRERKFREDHPFDGNLVVLALEDVPSDLDFDESVKERKGGLGTIVQKFLGGVSPGKHAIVMDAAGRNLHQIFFQERPRLNTIRGILKQLFEAVDHVHKENLMHGDLKMLNVVRFRRDNRLRLIDFDAAADIAKIGSGEKSYAGAKFSSAVLPPEMFHELKTNEEHTKFETYWKGAKKELSAKVKPKPYTERGVEKAWYVVKSFRTEDGEPVQDGLPYGLVEASRAIDAWSLGAIAYILLTGEPLIPATRDDDCASGAAMRVLHRWGTQPEVIVQLFKKISDDAARDLVRRLLQYHPEDRPEIATLLENHPFLNPERVDNVANDPDMRRIVSDMEESLKYLEQNLKEQAKHRKDDRALLEKIDENVTVIKKLGIENKVELRRTREVLLKGIFEATEVTTPTTFIVLNEKLPKDPPSKKVKDELLKIAAAADGSGVKVSGRYASVSFSADGASFGLEGEFKEYENRFNTGMKWANRMKSIGSDVAAGEVGGAFETIKSGLSDLMGDEMYLYLIDELTGEPVIAKGWPIVITTPSDKVPKLLPVMQVGMRAMSIYNGAAGVARMFGFPVPKVPKAWSKGTQESIEMLKKESSVADFSVVHSEVKDASEEEKSVRGASLREFGDFLKKHDPGLKNNGNGNFAGLQRIGDPEDGTALWTRLTDEDEIKSALETRAKQREEEFREHVEHVREEAKAAKKHGENRTEANERPRLPTETNAAQSRVAPPQTNLTMVTSEEMAEFVDAAKAAAVAAEEVVNAAKAATVAAEKAAAAANAGPVCMRCVLM